jgi:hypothetical protein
MFDDLEPFESAKELISGAKENLAHLESLCQPITKVRDYAFVYENDGKTGNKLLSCRFKNVLVTPRLRRLTSTILKELRLALDQAFYDAAVALGRKNAKGIYFPFGKDIKDLRREVERKCRDVNCSLVRYCLKFKPYYGGNPDLWSLSHLAGTTHRRIVGVQLLDNATFARSIVYMNVKGPPRGPRHGDSHRGLGPREKPTSPCNHQSRKRDSHTR